MTRRRPAPLTRLSAGTRRLISTIFNRLDYHALGRIYCDEGGAAFWRDRRGPCQRLGVAIATSLADRLPPGGRSLYVGAGVAEIPAIVMERHERGRTVEAYNLRRAEVRVLNRAGVTVIANDATSARGPFDHLWMASVLNDPERFPSLSALSYGRADPLAFDPRRFARERKAVRRLVAGCLNTLTLPALVTTTVEEVPWIREWAVRHRVTSIIEADAFPTALVGDPLCVVRVQQHQRPKPTGGRSGPSRY